MKKNNIYEGYIYKATCTITNKCYIGQTTRSFEKRKCEHLSAARSDKHPQKDCHFYRAIKKHSEENFEWEIIETHLCEDIDDLYNILFKQEEYYVDLYDSFNNGYNSNLGGIGSKGKPCTEETRKKLRLINLGRVRSEETKRRISEKKLGKLLSEEHKLKIKINTKKACENNIERSNKIREANSLRVKVYTEDGKLLNTFDSIKVGAEYYNLDPSYITKNCKRKALTSGKFGNLQLIWRYFEDSFTDEDRSLIKSNIVEVYDINGSFIKEFDCSKDAATYYNIPTGTVSNILSGKRKHFINKDNKMKFTIKRRIYHEERDN